MYEPELILLEKMDDTQLSEWVKNNKNIVRWKNKDEFISDTKFNYIFYSSYYNMKNQSENDVIYHYINYGFYANYKRNITEVENVINDDSESILNIETLIKKEETKILLVTHELSLTGGSLIIIDVYNFLKNKGYHIDLLNLTPKVNLINSDKNLDNYDIHKYDIILINTIAPNVIEWCNSNIKYLNKFILWIHETSDAYYTDELKKIKFKLVICDSYYVRSVYLKNINFSNTLIKVLYLSNDDYILQKNNININKSLLRKQYNIDINALVYLNIGTISNYKEQMDIICALTTAIEKKSLIHNILFLFVGNENNLLQEYINKSIHKKIFTQYIKIIPPVPFSECYKLYAMSDVYINCTKTEPYGRVLIESMEWNLPIIAYNGGSHKELIIHHFNGLLYNNCEELLEHILFLNTNKNLINVYGKNANALYLKKIPTKNIFYKNLISLFSLFINNTSLPKISYKKVYSRHIPELNLLESNYTIYKKKLYIFGGYTCNSTKCNNNVYLLDLNTNKFTQINTLPTDCAQTHFASTTHKRYHFIISGQIGDNFGKSTSSFYLYDLKKNKFIKMANTPFELFGSVCFIKDNTLTVFSGTNKTRVLPNIYVWHCKIYDDFNKIILNPVWIKRNTTIVGAPHGSLTKTNEKNEMYYFDGCECHTCSNQYTKSSYIHNCNNFKLGLLGKSIFEIESIEKSQFFTSHTQNSTFFKDEIIYKIGGQSNFDHVFNGCQLYYYKLDLWIELVIKEEYVDIFNKGCVSFVYKNKLYLFGGQFGDNNNLAKAKFNDTLFIFDLIY